METSPDEMVASYGQDVLHRYGRAVYERYLGRMGINPDLSPTANLALALAGNPCGHGSSAGRNFGFAPIRRMAYDPQRRRPI